MHAQPNVLCNYIKLLIIINRAIIVFEKEDCTYYILLYTEEYKRKCLDPTHTEHTTLQSQLWSERYELTTRKAQYCHLVASLPNQKLLSLLF